MFKFFLITVITGCLTSCSGILPSKPVLPEQLIGTWNCDSRHVELYVDFNITYMENKTFHIKGIMNGLFEGQVAMYGMTLNGTWSLKNDIIYENMQKIDVKGLNKMSSKFEQELLVIMEEEVGITKGGEFNSHKIHYIDEQEIRWNYFEKNESCKKL